MSNLRQETFLRVAKSLNQAAEQLSNAVDVLQASDYWANTSECYEIFNIKLRVKKLAHDFNPPTQK